MANYIITITVFSIASSFICIASPDNMRKYISLLSSVILIIIIVYPLNKNIDIGELYNFNITSDSEMTETDTNKIAAEYLAKSISSTINSEWKLEVERVIVKTNDISAFDVNTVVVYIKRSTNDTSIISKKIEELYKCKIKIIQEE